MEFLTDKIASAHLGKKSEGSVSYDSTLLVAVPRFENRERYSIDNDNLPFDGYDVWHGYEFSVMTENGLPVTRVLKLKYSCSSKFIVESKSLKLYLNSFNMSRFGKSVNEALDICKKIIAKDLSSKLESIVEVEFLSNKSERVDIFSEFDNLMDSINDKNLSVSEFNEAPHLLVVKDTEECQERKLMFESLRSNCRVTHQPDFGDVFIYYKSSKVITVESLIKYLVSFRSEYHFHEECCEMVYKRLSDILNKNDELFVCALYTRRGGIDISPARWSKNCNYLVGIAKLLDVNTFARFGIKQ